MTDMDISSRLSSISKEQLLSNFTEQLRRMKDEEAVLHREIDMRDMTIRQLQQQVANLQAQSQIDQRASDRILQSSRHEAQDIINNANMQAQTTLRQAHEAVESAQSKSNDIINQARKQAQAILDSQTNELKSQITMLQEQKRQAMSELVRCLNGVITSCDSFMQGDASYQSDISRLRANAASTLESVKMEQFVQSPQSVSEGSAPQQPVPMTQVAQPSHTQDTSDTDVSDSPLDALLSVSNANDSGTTANASDADDTIHLPKLHSKRRKQTIPQMPDDEPDDGGFGQDDGNGDQFKFDPQDLDDISDEDDDDDTGDYKSFTSEFGPLMSLDDDNADASMPSDNGDIDADYDVDDYDDTVNGTQTTQDTMTQKAKSQRHKRRHRGNESGQWL
jgi:cell division septum initiation protein DivIVA